MLAVWRTETAACIWKIAALSRVDVLYRTMSVENWKWNQNVGSDSIIKWGMDTDSPEIVFKIWSI